MWVWCLMQTYVSKRVLDWQDTASAAQVLGSIGSKLV